VSRTTTGDELRTARLHFAAELAAGSVSEEDLRSVRVRGRLGDGRLPPPPVRAAQRLAMKAGALTYDRACARPLDAARRSVLGEAAAGAPRFLVRVDELPHYRALDEPGRYGTAAFARFHAVLAEAGVPYLIAALPTLAAAPLDPADRGGRALDDDEAAALRALAADGVTIGLHGYDHRTRHAHPRRRSELTGLPAGALRARLDAGEAALQAAGLPRPRVFVPPFNRFAPEQYPVLAERYDVVCGGPETVRSLGFQRTPAWRGAAVYLPAYPPLYGTAAEVAPAAAEQVAARRALWVPIVLHWGWEHDQGLADLERLAGLLAPHAAAWDAFLTAVEAGR
jgi:peptidoglycan/xylan/chitin deacetylase (PgdA/CDA1 family)